jgi:hypothetical protein
MGSPVVEINGRPIGRADVQQYLKDKRISLWADWCITHPDRMDLAVDWLLTEIQGLAASVK